ncbi:MAG: S41 family peptidase [Anaerolineales bacterium]|nr:S41 family peptidase [Anaerolineales bacterium]
MRPFGKPGNAVHELYYQQPVDDQALVDGALRGMMEALPDDYSAYEDPQQTRDFQMYMSGEYEGIGAYVNTDAEFLTIVRPIPGSPAEAAGLKTGDQIIAVDGEDVTGLDPAMVRLKVLGPAGTQVTLTILRPGVEEPFDVTVTRAHIVIPSVEGKMLDQNIAYIVINLFGDDTGSEFHQILGDLLKQDPRGIIVDLRYNTGGYTTAARQVASEFLSSGVVWYEEYGNGERKEYRVLGGGLATDPKLPVVVLVNEHSASASELVAGALQDYKRAKLVGVTTFGKGTVQTLVPLSNGGTARITIARWLTPNNRTIQDTGLTPDVVIERTLEQEEAGIDPQLDAAIKLILNP